MTTRPQVVVGCDGSTESREAVAWAGRYARDTGGTVRLLSAWDWPTFQHVPITFGRWNPAKSAAAVLKRMRAGLDLADDRVQTRVVRGSPGRALSGHCFDADLLVVGSHGLGAVSRLILGSVSSYCAAQAPCPVVIVRAEGGKSGGRVLVGVDDSDQARRALRWAMDYADLVRLPLTVAHVVEPPPMPVGMPPTSIDPTDIVHGQVRSWVEELVDKEQADRGRALVPGVEILVLDGNPAHEMVEQSQDATLTVCGRRGAGGFHRLLVGSVASALAHHGQSSLAVIPSG